MPKYLFQVAYTTEGLRGVLADGGSKRRTAAAALIKSFGGKMESLHFAFGGTDAFCIADLPDNASAAAAAMAVSASGAAGITTTVLMTPKEVDEVTGKSGKYRPPGG